MIAPHAIRQLVIASTTMNRAILRQVKFSNMPEPQNLGLITIIGRLGSYDGLKPSGILEGDELAATGQRDRIVEAALPAPREAHDQGVFGKVWDSSQTRSTVKLILVALMIEREISRCF
jgi:hypothetical protein